MTSPEKTDREVVSARSARTPERTDQHVWALDEPDEYRCTRCQVWKTDLHLYSDPTTCPSPKIGGNLKVMCGKAPLHLLPARPLRVLAAAMEDGAKRYAPWNYREHTDDVRELYGGALLRHVTSFTDPGESDYAEDTGVHHLACAGACILILLDRLDVEYPALDPDRGAV